MPCPSDLASFCMARLGVVLSFSVVLSLIIMFRPAVVRRSSIVSQILGLDFIKGERHWAFSQLRLFLRLRLFLFLLMFQVLHHFLQQFDEILPLCPFARAPGLFVRAFVGEL